MTQSVSAEAPTLEQLAQLAPGAVITPDCNIELLEGRKLTQLVVVNKGDRPIQVGSHYHFFEVNPALSFDRDLAYGKRLAIAAGTAVRFEPGEEREIKLTLLKGNRVVHGFQGKINGPLRAEKEQS